MFYAAGDPVVVISLNRRGTVIDQRGKTVRVLLGGLVVSAREDDVRPADQEKRQRKAGRATGPSAAPPAPSGPEARRVRSIDLHGLTVQEARAAVLAFLNEALLDGASEIEIVHGRGTGRLRQAVTTLLGELEVVRNARLHPGNPGITLVQL